MLEATLPDSKPSKLRNRGDLQTIKQNMGRLDMNGSSMERRL